MARSHMTNAKLEISVFSSIFCTYRSMLYIIMLLPLVTVVIFVLYHASSIKRLTSTSHHNLVEVHKSLNVVSGTSAIIDSTGEYHIVKWLSKPAYVFPGDATLISQCSASRLRQFLDLLHAWDGPVSLAVFVESSSSLFIVVNYLLQVQLCLPHALSKLSIQLVMPLWSSTDCCTELLNISCSNFLPAFDKHWAGIRNYDGLEDYPNNLLRNVAIDAAISDYIFVVDIDMIPSSGLFSQFHEFIGKQPADRKIAFIVPVFEMKLESEMPVDRDALLQMWDHGIIEPFYSKVCWKCQSYTDYDMWRNLTIKCVKQMNIAYVVEWHDPWEPFYIVDKKAPKYDEKFKNYGFNRISQVNLITYICVITIELCVTCLTKH